MHGLGREHDEIAGPGFARVGSGVDLHRAVTRGALDAQTFPPYSLDVLAPAVDRPHLVAGGREQPGVHRAHRSRSNDRYFHERKIGVRARFPVSPLPLWEIGL